MNFEEIIEKAAKQLNDIYFMTGDSMEKYEPIKIGFIMGLALAMDEEPHAIEAQLNTL